MAQKAPTVLTYLESEFASFAEVPFNALDALAFAELSMVRFEGVAGLPASPRELLLAEHYPVLFSGIIADSLKRTVLAMAASPRFRALAITDVCALTSEDTHTQFAACTIQSPDFAVVAFRGTDGTVTGWREDCNMACSWPVPGQEQARSYLESACEKSTGPLYVVGHSKGGNLAAYAAVKARPAAQERIARVYDFDGPGFVPQAVTDEEYERMAGRIEKVIPHDSVVGLLLESRHDWRVVVSHALSVMQHDAFTWEVDLDARDFAGLEAPSAAALYVHDVMAGWLEKYSPAELCLFVDTLFCALRTMAGSDSMADIFKEGENPLPLMLQAVREANGEGRALALKMLGELTVSAAITAGRTVSERVQDAAQELAGMIPDVLVDAGAKPLGEKAEEQAEG